MFAYHSTAGVDNALKQAEMFGWVHAITSASEEHDRASLCVEGGFMRFRIAAAGASRDDVDPHFSCQSRETPRAGPPVRSRFPCADDGQTGRERVNAADDVQVFGWMCQRRKRFWISMAFCVEDMPRSR